MNAGLLHSTLNLPKHDVLSVYLLLLPEEDLVRVRSTHRLRTEKRCTGRPVQLQSTDSARTGCPAPAISVRVLHPMTGPIPDDQGQRAQILCTRARSRCVWGGEADARPGDSSWNEAIHTVASRERAMPGP